MTKFIPVRHTDTSKVTCIDGQFLVDTSNGTIAVDVGVARTYSKYVYGIVKPIAANTWIQSNGLYYIDVTSLAEDSLPDGHSVVGASLISGAATSKTSIEDNKIKITAYDRTDGSILIFALAGTGHSADYDMDGLISLYHMEEPINSVVDSIHGTPLKVLGCSSELDHRYGTRSLFRSKHTNGQLILPVDYVLNSFTIEWWQKDVASDGDGGVVLQDKNENSITIPVVTADSDIYVTKEWKHFALVHRYDGKVATYLNGNIIGYTQVDTPLEGPFIFYGAQSATGMAKNCYIDELAIFNYARYTQSFDVPTVPYIGHNELQLAVSSDISITGSVGDTFSVELPVTQSDDREFSCDLSGISRLSSDAAIDGITLSGTISNATSDDYYIEIKKPGSISRNITVHVNPQADDGDKIYYGYFTSDTITSVKDITISELEQSTIHTMYDTSYNVIIRDIPAGAFTFVLVPSALGKGAAKKTIMDTYTSFYEDAGTTGTGSNGSEISLYGITYNVYGEFNLTATDTIIMVSSEFSPEASEYGDVMYVGEDLYTPATEDGSIVYIKQNPVSVNSGVTVTGAGNLDGVYVYDEVNKTWSK